MSTSGNRPGDEAAPAPQGGGEGRGADEGASPERRPGSAALAWRGAKYFAYGVGAVLLAVMLLAVVVVLLLQTEWGARQAKHLILAQVNPLGTEQHEARLEIDDIDGSWLGGLELRGVRLFRPRQPSDGPATAPGVPRDSVRMVQVDSVKVDYRLLGLLSNRVEASNVQVYGPDVRATQQPDGAWDLLQPFLAGPDTTTSAWEVRLDSVRVERGSAEAKFYTRSGADSTLRVRDLRAFVSGVGVGGAGTPRADVRNLSMRFTPPGQTLERQFAVSGKLDERELALDRLTLDSPYSDVSGRGTLVLPGAEGGPVENIDFRLEGKPLSFRDLAGFVPNLDPERSVRFEAHAGGTSERLQPSLDATFSDGGTARLSGTVAPGFGGGALAYDLEGQVRDLDPGFFTAGPEAGRINGDVSVDLSGASAQALSGTARAEVFDTRYGEYVLDRTTFAARFDDGTATIDAQGGLRGAAFAASGTVQPFGQPVTYDLRSTFRNVDVGRFTGDPQQSSDLDGQISFQGYGTSLADANLTARLALDGSRINQFAVNEGQFDVRLLDGKMSLGARVRSPQGRADVDGNVWLTEDPLRYQISQGRLEDVDVAALTGDTTRSRISGTFRLQGSGTTPQQDLRLDVADLRLTDSYYGPYVINATNLDVRLAGGRMDASGQADLDGGTFALRDAAIYPFRPVPAYRVGSASFSHVDIGTLGQYPASDSTGAQQQSSDLNGSVSLKGSGYSPPTMDVSGTARLAESRLNRQHINSAAVEFSLRNGLFAYDGTLAVPEGQTHIAGTVEPFSESPSFAISEGTFDGLNVGALAGIEGLNTSLQGRVLSFEGSFPQGGFSLDSLNANAVVDVGGSTINEAAIDRGRLRLRSDEGQAQLSTDLQFAGGGRVGLDGQVDLRGEAPSYRAEGTVDSLDVGALMGDAGADARLNLALDLEGQGTDPETMTLRADVNARDTRVADIDVRRLALRFDMREGAVRVDTLALRSNVADATGHGTLALFNPPERYSSNFAFTASVDSLAPVRPFLSDSLRTLSVGENELSGRVTGRPSGVLRVEAEGRLAGLVYNDVRVADFEGAVSAVLSGGLAMENLQNAQARGEAGYIATSNLDARNADFDATYDGDTVSLTAGLSVDERRDLQISGVLDPRPDRQRFRLDTLNVRFGPDRWKLLQDATITYGDQYRVSGLLLYTDDQQLAVDGTVDFDGEQSLVLTLENFRLDAVADLLGYEGLAGSANGSIDLTGPAASPALDGSLRLDIESEGDAVGDLRLALDYANQRLGLDARLTHRDGSMLTAEGHLPLDLRLQRPEGAGARVAADSALQAGGRSNPADFVEVEADTASTEAVALTIQADSFAVGWAKPFLDPEQVERIDGRLTADITVGGTLRAPRVQGTAAFSDGVVEMTALGATYRNIRATARLTGDQVQLREAALESSGGRLTARGTVNLQALTLGELDLSMQATDFEAVDTEAYRATVDGDLQLQGTTEAPVLRGTLDVQSADIYLDAFGANTEYEEVRLSEADVRTLRERFGVNITEADTTTSDLYRALAMEMDVQIERDTWLHSASNPELDVQFDGDLDLQKEAQQDLQLFGSIEVLPERSRVVQFGKRFSIAEGVLTFNGNPADPVLDLSAEYNVAARRSRGDEVTITLAVRGRLDDLEFSLGSDPSMETTDVLSYLATGRPADETFVGGGSGGAEGFATGAALSQATNFIENVAGESLGLDIVEIEQDPQRGTLLTAGNYVYFAGLPNPLFIAVSQPLGSSNTGGTLDDENATEVTLEYELTEGLLLRLLRRNAVRMNLRFEYAY